MNFDDLLIAFNLIMKRDYLDTTNFKLIQNNGFNTSVLYLLIGFIRQLLKLVNHKK